MNRLYGTSVASSYDSIASHITKHKLGITLQDYVAIGDQLSSGNQGKFSGLVKGKHFTAIVDGKVCIPTESGSTAIFGLLRSVRRGA